jgi:predicted dehydrogenase
MRLCRPVILIRAENLKSDGGIESMFKTAIIGAGDISRQHAKALHDLGIGIAGVLDLNTARAQELADQYNSRVIQKLEEVLTDVDMVHIFTPPSKRVEYVRQAAAAGKHLFIEKPIAVSINDAREIVALVTANRVKLMIGFNMRFRAGYRMLQEAVRDGRLGKVIGVFINRLSGGAGFGGVALSASWRTNPNFVCGMSIESLSHDIDMILHLVDGIESVSANTYGSIPELPTFDNNSSVTFRLKNGGTGTIHLSGSSYLGYNSRGVIGTKGTAMFTGDNVFDFTNFIIKTEDMSYPQSTKIDDRFAWERQAHQSYLEINRHFKECIEQNLLPLASGEDGLRALIFSQAILESNRTGHSVLVDL